MMKNFFLFSLLTTMTLNAAPQGLRVKKSEEDCKPTVQECLGQGEPLTCCGPGYNAPAAIDVNQIEWSCCPIGFTSFIDVAFTYWYAGQDGMTIANTAVLNGGNLYFPQTITNLVQDFDYKPGFKVKAGVTLEHECDLFAEYTWYRGTHQTNSPTVSGTILTTGTITPANGTQVWQDTDWFLQSIADNDALCGPQISSSWELSMDLIDVLASRPFYEAQRLVISPFAGLEVALIRQWMNVDLTESSSLFSGALPQQPIRSQNHSSSWSIGPKVGAGARYLLPLGMRFEGKAGGALLYTTYDIDHTEPRAATTFNPLDLTTSYANYTTLRPAAELGLGFAWGSYIFCKDYHIDFAADYDFMLFWSQNVIRKLLDETLYGTGAAAGDLFLHGMTLTARFDF